MSAAPEIEHYDWAGGREAMLRFGPGEGPIAVLALPLFEEANRTRAFAVTLLRALAARGVGGALPDLPGQGDSLVPLETLSLLRLQEGYEGLIDTIRRRGRPAYAIGLRSGALLDGLGRVHGRWYLAPQGGAGLLAELRRVKQASVGHPLGDRWFLDGTLPPGAPPPPVEIAGNLLSIALLTDLTVKEPWTTDDGGPVRVIRIATDPRPADRHVDAAPLWRRAEPGNDPALALLLAEDIAGWIARCEG